MMKKVIPIILFTVSAILLSACGRKEELYEIPDLSQYKTDCPGKDDAFAGDLYVQWNSKGSVLEKDKTDSWRERPVFDQYQLYL